MRRSQLRFAGSALLFVSSSLLPLAAQDISDSAKQQIAEVYRLKKSLNGSQQKLSSGLLIANLQSRQLSTGSISDQMAPAANVDVAGNVVVDIRANSLADAMTAVSAVGGTILSSSDSASTLKAQVPVASLETIAASDAVKFIKSPSRARTNSVHPVSAPFLSPTVAKPVTRHSRQAELRSEMGTALPLLAANGFYPSMRSLLPLRMSPFIGALTSQGYVTHEANQAVTAGFDGTGVRIGVLSDSASPGRVAALIATGDLPPDTVVLPGQAGPSNGEDEGTAMMEIIHDMAPGAKLFFATAFDSEDGFADNIRTLRSVYGCDIIVDDVSYFDEPAFQDGLVARAVNDVTAAGALYFSSSANSGNLTSNTSGTWEGDFRSAGDAGLLVDTFEGATVQALNFSLNGATVGYNTLTGATDYIFVHWADPIGASANDYDAFVLSGDGSSLLAYSIDPQTGTQDPIEGLALASGASFPVGSRLLIVKWQGAARAIHVDTERGKLAIATAGATIGHNAGINTVSMAATYWNSARRGTVPFTSANRIESFSSDGPRKIFYTPDGVAITPGNLLFETNGGTTLQKPDLTAADGIYTKTPGFLPFFGTSAAAPHAAAIAALVKSANPFLTNAQIKQIMMNTAIDTMAVGPDRDSGYGITMALPAVQAALGQ